MRFPRVTVRRMMVAVTISGLLLGVGLTWTRRATYRGLADLHAAWRDHFDHLVICPDCLKDEGFATSERPRCLAGYHKELAWRYEKAVRRPWLPLSPDPTEPE